MTTPNRQKRKHQSISLAEKQSIIETSKTKPKTSELVKHFKNKYGESTIRTILKNKDKIQEAIDEGVRGKRVRLKSAKHSKLKEALLKWLKDVRSENIAVNGPILKEKATKLAELLRIDDFKASEGWLSNFKERHGIVFRSVQREAAALNLESVDKWRQDMLSKLLAEYSPNGVINVDQDLATVETRTLEDIAASTSGSAQIGPDSEEDEPKIQPNSLISRQEAYQSFDRLRRYIEENATDPKAIQYCHYFEDFFHQEQVQISVQASITKIFEK